MNFYSTRNHRTETSLRRAVLQGLAPDGGLYMPSVIPALPRAFFNNISQMSLVEIAYVVSNMFLGDDIDSESIKTIVTDSLNFDIPVVPIDGTGISAMELFHGPTLAIKDVGARFMARLLRHYSAPGQQLNILVATSGDTGSAVAAGFHNMPGVRVFILYPSGKVSDIQEAQFTTLGHNVTAIEVYGSFDDCQALVKQAFVDRELTERLPLTSANSINIARLLPQTLYFFHGYARMVERGADPSQVVASIPCGNLGTLTAACIARRMGLPIKRIIAVNNVDGFFSRYLATGSITPVELTGSVTSAIDVANPSNIERIIDLYHGERDKIAADISARIVDDERILSTIAEVDSRYNYILDPHGAAAYAALVDDIALDEAGLIVAAAHPAKFRDTVEKAISRCLPAPQEVQELLMRPRHRKRILPNYRQFKEYLLNHSK